MTILLSLPTPIEYLSLSLSGITFTIISEPDGKIQSVDNNTKKLVLTLSQKSEWARPIENASCQLTIFSNQGEIKVNGSLTTDGTVSTDKEVTATIQLASPVDQQNVIKDLMVDITPAKPN